jgi:hypothetical protein
MSQEAELVDRQGSPKRRQVDEFSILPVFAEQDDLKENETNDENPNESTPGEQEDFQDDDITGENATNNSERNVKDEDGVIEKLLRQAEKNLSTLDSKDHIPPRIKLDPGPLPEPYLNRQYTEINF